MDININDIRNCVKEWSDWFNGFPESTLSNTGLSRFSITDNTQVIHCLFFNIESSITLVKDEISLYVDDCSFVECHSNDDGGAIYLLAESHSVLNKICAFNCNTTPNQIGQFCFITVSYYSMNKNIAHLVSVCDCTQYENSNKWTSIDFRCGNITLNNVNSSSNRCHMFSGVYISNPLISFTTQSTFSNNTADNYICINFFKNIHHLSQCNIIGNHQKNTFGGTIFIDNAITILSECVIDWNTGSAKIIYVDSGNITLNSCYLQSNIQSYGTIITNSQILLNQSLILYHFNSIYCDALNLRPSETFRESPIATLIDTFKETPIETTPINSLRETPLETQIDTFRETPIDTPEQTVLEDGKQNDGILSNSSLIWGISGIIVFGGIFTVGFLFMNPIISDSIKESSEDDENATTSINQ